MKSFTQKKMGYIFSFFLIVTSAFIFLKATPFSFLMDDSFITYRYGEIFLRCGRLSFNCFGDPIEGYTSLLWVLISIVPQFLGVDPLNFSKVLNLILVTAIFYTAFKNIKSSVFFCVFVFCIIAYTPTRVHLMTGMETFLGATLFFYSIVLLEKILSDYRAVDLKWLSFIWLLLGLVRPESNAIALILIVLLFFELEFDRKRFTKIVSFYYLLPGAAYFLIRYLYYDHLFPLPFYLKVANSGQFFQGVVEFRDFIVNTWALFLLLFAIAIKYSKLKRIIIVLPFLLVVVFFIKVKHLMGWDSRFFYVVYPALVYLSIVQVRAFSSRALKVCSIFVLVFYPSRMAIRSLRNPPYAGYRESIEKAHVALANDLKVNKGKNIKLRLAVGDAGIIPYVSGIETVDTFGLNDNVLAFSKTKMLDYLTLKRPNVIVLLSGSSAHFVPLLIHEADIFKWCQDRGYTLSRVYEFSSKYALFVFTSPDIQGSIF